MRSLPTGWLLCPLAMAGSVDAGFHGLPVAAACGTAWVVAAALFPFMTTPAVFDPLGMAVASGLNVEIERQTQVLVDTVAMEPS